METPQLQSTPISSSQLQSTPVSSRQAQVFSYRINARLSGRRFVRGVGFQYRVPTCGTGFTSQMPLKYSAKRTVPTPFVADNMGHKPSWPKPRNFQIKPYTMSTCVNQCYTTDSFCHCCRSGGAGQFWERVRVQRDGVHFRHKGRLGINCMLCLQLPNCAIVTEDAVHAVARCMTEPSSA